MTSVQSCVPRAVVGDTLGLPENYRLKPADPADPRRGLGEVRYVVHAAAVSDVDVLIAVCYC